MFPLAFIKAMDKGNFMKKPQNKILFVEDEFEMMHIYKTALQEAKIKVESAVSGKDAMEMIKEIQEGKKEKPDLVLLDLVLPDINGLEILYALKKNEATKDISVFILSNYSSDALLNMTYIKPEKFLIKADIPPTQLVNIIKDWLKNEKLSGVAKSNMPKQVIYR